MDIGEIQRIHKIIPELLPEEASPHAPIEPSPKKEPVPTP